MTTHEDQEYKLGILQRRELEELCDNQKTEGVKMKSIFDLMDENMKQLEQIQKNLHNHKEENMAINIILADSDDGSPSRVFVEIENDNGESIRIGEELTTEEGYRKLRISTSDIINHLKIL